VCRLPRKGAQLEPLTALRQLERCLVAPDDPNAILGRQLPRPRRGRSNEHGLNLGGEQRAQRRNIVAALQLGDEFCEVDVCEGLRSRRWRGGNLCEGSLPRFVKCCDHPIVIGCADLPAKVDVRQGVPIRLLGFRRRLRKFVDGLIVRRDLAQSELACPLEELLNDVFVQPGE
jgi:hypothetical protein